MTLGFFVWFVLFDFENDCEKNATCFFYIMFLKDTGFLGHFRVEIE